MSTRSKQRRTKTRGSTSSGTRDKHNVNVRTAYPSDAAGIAALSGQLGYPISSGAMARLLRTVGRRRNQKIFVATLRGKVIGWLEIFLPISVLNSGKAEIGALVVDTQARRLGVGSALMDKAHEWAVARDAPFIYLRSNVIRKEAHEFYKRAGYTMFKTQRVFRKVFTKYRTREH